jgi:hypothetical protein
VSLSFFFLSAITLGFFLIPCVKNTTKQQKKKKILWRWASVSVLLCFLFSVNSSVGSYSPQAAPTSLQ